MFEKIAPCIALVMSLAASYSLWRVWRQRKPENSEDVSRMLFLCLALWCFMFALFFSVQAPPKTLLACLFAVSLIVFWLRGTKGSLRNIPEERRREIEPATRRLPKWLLRWMQN